MRFLPRYHRLVPAAHRRLLGAVSLSALLFAAFGMSPVAAVELLSIDQDRILYGEEGSLVTLADEVVVPDMIGAVCTLRVNAENQFSVHPGNDLLVTTGGTQTVIPDVEAEPDGDSEKSATVVLGHQVVVALRFGPHQVSSMGFQLEVDCGSGAPAVLAGQQTCDAAAGTTTDGDTDAGTAGPVTEDCGETTPPAEVTPPDEVAVAPPSIPQPCEGDGGGSLSVDDDDGACPTTPAVEGDSVTSTPTTAPPPTTGAPTTSAPTTAPPATTSAPQPTVLGLQIERLPQTPAAPVVPAAPSYTG